jgi:hypothetical protein
VNAGMLSAMTYQAPVMLLFFALIQTARQKFKFYSMKKAGLHRLINVETSRLVVQQVCKSR